MRVMCIVVVHKSHSLEAPKADDKLRIYYYRASDDDVLEVDILETVKTW